jgi:hypothetical protein
MTEEIAVPGIDDNSRLVRKAMPYQGATDYMWSLGPLELEVCVCLNRMILCLYCSL